MTKVYLYRHGETEENRKHILQGCTPGTLTAEGKIQIAESAPALTSIPFDFILSSDIKRCKDTAEILNRTLNLDIIYSPLLRERDWGSATGMVVDGKTKIKIPDDAETVEQLQCRSRQLLDFIAENYPEKTILAVSHGLICRFIQAVHTGVSIADIVPMKNTETRLITING